MELNYNRCMELTYILLTYNWKSQGKKLGFLSRPNTVFGKESARREGMWEVLETKNRKSKDK